MTKFQKLSPVTKHNTYENGADCSHRQGGPGPACDHTSDSRVWAGRRSTTHNYAILRFHFSYKIGLLYEISSLFKPAEISMPQPEPTQHSLEDIRN